MRFMLSLISTVVLLQLLFVPTVESFLTRSSSHVRRPTAENRHQITRNVLLRVALSMTVDDGESSVGADVEVQETSTSGDSFSDMFTRGPIVSSASGVVAVEEPEVKALIPYEEEVKKYENKLQKDLEYLESSLKFERGLLTTRKDAITMSGKNGYFFVQAEVAEFQKRKEREQKARVLRNKKDFVEKMLPVVDAFRAAPTVAPAANEREESMHKNFGSLCKSIITVFEKYGYGEFDAEIGSAVVPSLHEVSELVGGDVGGVDLRKVIVSQLRPGIADKEGDILRRSLVIATMAALKQIEVKREVEVLEEVEAGAPQSW